MAVTSGPLSSFEEAFIHAAHALTGRLDVEMTCSAVLDAVEQLFEARSAWVLLHDVDTSELVTVMFRGPDAESYAHARVPLRDRTITTIVFHQRQPLFVADVREEDRWYDTLRVHASSLRTVFTVPLVYQDTPVGVIGIDSPHFSADAPPTDEDTARLQAIAAQAAIGINNARLYAAVTEDRARMKRLLEPRRQFRTTVAHLREQIREVQPPVARVGNSPAFRAVLEQAELVSEADTTVLLVGETGTGKELIARAIHDDSRRRGHAFVAVNCAAIPESLIESELFGYEKGAFTGALDRKAGKFEIADRGTMLLDEIGDLPAQAQAKLLRVLQEREVQRVGATKPVPINVRVIAATNRDLEACIEAGTFRPDLFYRLSVFPIYLPPLRERREDIPGLVSEFVSRFAERQHSRCPTLAPGVMQQLLDYDWPGNIRELQNVLERAVILAKGGQITADGIALRRSAELVTNAGADPAPVRSVPNQQSTNVLPFADAERCAIVRALELTGWRISGAGGAAEVLSLKPTTLHAKMKKLGINRPSLHAAS